MTTTTIDLDAIRQRVERIESLADQDATGLRGQAYVAAVALAANLSAADVPDLLAEVDRLRAQLDKPCGSCHPCTNYRDETWRAADRKPPHVIDWDDAQAELKALRLVAEAAKAWVGASVATIEHRPHEEALYAAVQSLPDPKQHEDICPGYGCPGCRTEPASGDA